MTLDSSRQHGEPRPEEPRLATLDPSSVYATTAQVAAHFQMSPDVIRDLSQDPETGFPAPVRLSKRNLRFVVAEVLAYEARQRAAREATNAR